MKVKDSSWLQLKKEHDSKIKRKQLSVRTQNWGGRGNAMRGNLTNTTRQLCKVQRGILPSKQTRSHEMAWGGKCQPWTTGCQRFATSGEFFVIFYCHLMFADKERFPANFGSAQPWSLWKTRKFNFSCTHIVHLIVIALSMR